ncbi:DUF982 domain-containing protein [Rhizobium grahamii]
MSLCVSNGALRRNGKERKVPSRLKTKMSEMYAVFAIARKSGKHRPKLIGNISCSRRLGEVWRSNSEDLMSAAIDIRKAKWTSPVAIRIGKRSPEFIHGPDEAIDYLEHRWPQHEGAQYEAARRRCIEAVNNLRHPEIAREAFIAAAAEAKVLA